MERIGLGYLFDDQLVGPSSPLYWAFGAVFLLLLASSIYVYLQAPRRFPDNRLHRRLAHQYARLAGGFSGLGLAATSFALLAVPFLSKRLWLAIAALGLLATAAHGFFYFRRRYPREQVAFQQAERRHRYLPRPRAATRRRRGRRR